MEPGREYVTSLIKCYVTERVLGRAKGRMGGGAGGGAAKVEN